jgi:hypothetical protein
LAPITRGAALIYAHNALIYAHNASSDALREYYPPRRASASAGSASGQKTLTISAGNESVDYTVKTAEQSGKKP